MATCSSSLRSKTRASRRSSYSARVSKLLMALPLRLSKMRRKRVPVRSRSKHSQVQICCVSTSSWRLTSTASPQRLQAVARLISQPRLEPPPSSTFWRCCACPEPTSGTSTRKSSCCATALKSPSRRTTLSTSSSRSLSGAHRATLETTCLLPQSA